MIKHPPLSPEVYLKIKKEVLPFSKGNYLEIGSYNGGGICSLAELFPEKKFFSIESFIENCENEKLFIENKQETKNVILIKINSLIFCSLIKLNLLNLNELKVDTILIDGNHDYKYVCGDIYTSIKILQDNIGFIFFHDTSKDPVIQAVNEFEEKLKNYIVFKYIGTVDETLFIVNFDKNSIDLWPH